MYAFDYHRPTSVRQAANLLGKLEEAKIVAGGHTLLPTMKQRLAAPANLVDLSGLKELRGIERSARSVTIGAMTTHAEVSESAEVKAAIPALAELAEMIGDPAVRHRGTIGGSVANNDPAADYPAACLALGATIVTNKRKIGADDYFKGLFETALEEGEIVTKVTFPIPQKSGYMKFRNPASRYALVGVFVAKRAAEIRVAVTGAGQNGVFRWTAAEEALKKRFAAKSLEGLSHPAENLNSDIHADATYRAHLIGVMARRAVAAATDRE
jgi:aerobic carbon-monoxide dehydrogenase medium subunit